MKPLNKLRAWLATIPRSELWAWAVLYTCIVIGITQTVLLYVIVCELHR